MIAEYEKSIETKGKSCNITDEVVKDYILQKEEISKATESVISKIDRLPASNAPTKPKEVYEDNTADIDDLLPASLSGVLSEVCRSDKGDRCVPSQ